MFDVEGIKERERKFREKDIPFGEFTLKTKTKFWNEIELRNVFAYSGIRGNDRILDVGCSDGRLLEYVHNRLPGCELHGIDFVESHLNLIKEKAFESHLACGDICKMSYEDAFFDRVFFVNTLQQIPSREERLKVLKKIHRCLADSGSFVVTVLNRCSWKDMVDNGKEGSLKTARDIYVYLYDSEELRRDLEECGFRVRKLTGINNLPVWRLRKLRGLGVLIDIMISKYFTRLSMEKGRYILASCTKKRT